MLDIKISPYRCSDKSWSSFQTKIDDFIKENGDKSSKHTSITTHPDWENIKDVIAGKKHPHLKKDGGVILYTRWISIPRVRPIALQQHPKTASTQYRDVFLIPKNLRLKLEFRLK